MALTLTDDQAARLLELLGLPADTTDIDTILATVEDLAAAESAGGGKPSEIAAAAGRIGLTVIDADTLAALRADADEGRRIQAAAAKAEIDGKVDHAIRHGKITPARRKHWVDLITADPAMADVLASVPNETAVPLTEIGHSYDSEANNLTDTPPWFR
ncbi:phage protease [Nocardia otitidiscaviarum]|uniref:phage protease n=1 Tax=Nocardia otitidiscaviarum TaxID=1823 RepID=UPI0024555FAD|nr:phage protease [Nocardia otitidiscaviarum]